MLKSIVFYERTLGGILLLSSIRTLLSRHFSQHITLYFVVTLCFSIGIASGVFSVKALNQIQKDQLIDFLVSSFKYALIDNQLNSNEIFWHSIINNLKMAFLFWLFAITIITFPFILILIGIKGFVLGFTVGFLIDNLGYKGILFTLVTILPQNIIFIPVLITLCIVSISYSAQIIKNRRVKRSIRNENFKYFLRYSLVTIFICIILVVGCLIEGYITPILLKGVSGYLLK